MTKWPRSGFQAQQRRCSKSLLLLRPWEWGWAKQRVGSSPRNTRGQQEVAFRNSGSTAERKWGVRERIPEASLVLEGPCRRGRAGGEGGF